MNQYDLHSTNEEEPSLEQEQLGADTSKQSTLPYTKWILGVGAVLVMLAGGVFTGVWFAGSERGAPVDLSVSESNNGKGNTDSTERENKEGSPTRKIVPPENGMYLGQTSFGGNEVALFERAAGKKAAIYAHSGGGVVRGIERPDEGALSFNTELAQQLWNNGYVFYIFAYEASPAIGGNFTVDRLLRGDYDDDLKRFAGELKEFGNPMFFSTAREVNGGLSDWFGGFGVAGDKRLSEVVKKGEGFAQFTPPAGPSGNPNLYTGLGDPQVCDGIERLAAAQRYYHDFFVRREGIDFLTFETMGWLPPIALGEDFAALSSLEQNCHNFTQFYKLIADYSDWISINAYDYTPLNQGKSGMQLLMEEIRAVAPEKPVLITELGFCAPNKNRVGPGLTSFLNDFPEISGFTMWFTHGLIGKEKVDCLIKPNTPSGDTLKQVVAENSDSFHSCVQFSDGTTIPNCDPNKLQSLTEGIEDNSMPSDFSPDYSSCVTSCNAEPGNSLQECEAYCAQQ